MQSLREKMALRRFGLVLLVGLSLPCVPGVARAEEAISAEARGYFRNGVELLQSDPPNFQDAYYQFKLAYEKSGSWKVLGNLGLCAVKLERDGEALGFYEEYLSRGGDEINKEERDAIERDMLLIRGNGATFELSSKLDALRIQDSRTGSNLAAQSYEMTDGTKTIFVRAGGHRLTARTGDGRTLVWDVTIEPGATIAHEFDFDAPPEKDGAAGSTAPAVAPTDAGTTPAASGGGGTLSTIGFITGGVGLAALGGAGVSWLMARSKEDSAREKCVKNVCDSSAKPLFREANDLADISTGLLVGGGVLAVAGLGMVIGGYAASDAGASPTGGVTLVPIVARGGAALSASGTF